LNDSVVLKQFVAAGYHYPLIFPWLLGESLETPLYPSGATARSVSILVTAGRFLLILEWPFLRFSLFGRASL
tara:strand:+ start:1504 stop:1719 length:216 start_codon:yes stop_codon:yes gene_type:complete